MPLSGCREIHKSQASDPYSAWPRYGEIDVMENPVGNITGQNNAHQTVHMGNQATGTYKKSDDSECYQQNGSMEYLLGGNC